MKPEKSCKAYFCQHSQFLQFVSSSTNSSGNNFFYTNFFSKKQHTVKQVSTLLKMTKWLKWPLTNKNSFFLIAKKSIVNKNLNYLKLDPMFCLANIIVKLMAKAFQKTLTFTHYITNYGRHVFLKLVNAISLLPKTVCLCFLIKKQNNVLP